MNKDAALVQMALVAFVISGVGYMTLSPFYETGVMKVIVPALSVLDFVFAFGVWKRTAWLKKWMRPIAIGTLIIAVPFWGRSSEYHGTFAIPMLVVESATVVAGLCLLILSFRPDFRLAKDAG